MGGGGLCEVLHPTLAGGGGENDTRGGKCPPLGKISAYSPGGPLVLGRTLVAT